MKRLLAWAISAACLVAATGSASAAFPDHTIRVITLETGSSTDILARMIAQGISGPLDQPVVVENHPGVVAVSAGIVARAPADGYTLYVAQSSFWLSPFLYKDLPWDPIRDFTPITAATEAPNVLVVNPKLPVHSTQDLIALAKSEPGKLNFSSAILGASSQLAGALFFSMANINVKSIPYSGSVPGMKGVLAGETQIGFPAASTALQFVKSGSLRALAVTSAEPSALLPGLPTVASAGLPGYESTSMQAVFVRAQTPPAVVQLLNQQIVRVLNSPDVKKKLFDEGIEVIADSPSEAAARVQGEMTRMSKVIEASKAASK